LPSADPAGTALIRARLDVPAFVEDPTFPIRDAHDDFQMTMNTNPIDSYSLSSIS
jgi:hypothetical protein